MSRRRKKNSGRKTRPDSPALTIESTVSEVTPAISDKETGETRSLGSQLGAFAILLGVHLALLGFFYAMAAAYPAKTKIIAVDRTCLADKTVMVSARIHYGIPPLLRSKPPNVLVRIGLQGQKPVEALAGPSSETTVALVAPPKAGDYTIEIEADPDGSAGIGPIRTSARLEVIAPAKSPGS